MSEQNKPQPHQDGSPLATLSPSHTQTQVCRGWGGGGGGHTGSHFTDGNTKAPGESQALHGDTCIPPGGRHRESRRSWCRGSAGQVRAYPVLVVDDLHQTAMLRLDGWWRHGLLGLRWLGGLLLQLLLWGASGESGVVSTPAGGRRDSAPCPWAGGRHPGAAGLVAPHRKSGC